MVCLVSNVQRIDLIFDKTTLPSIKDRERQKVPNENHQIMFEITGPEQKQSNTVRGGQIYF